LHSCREAPAAHDDAAVLSHDAYRLVGAELPDNRPVLERYFEPLTQGEAAAFAGQNGAAALAAHSGRWLQGEVVMAVDAALGIVPAAATATPTATPTATSTPDTPTATVTVAPSATLPRATATRTEQTPPGGARLFLPLMVAGR
jgi:hypothetical protein